MGGGAGGKRQGLGNPGIVNIGGGGNSEPLEYYQYVVCGAGGAGVVILYYPCRFNSGSYTYTDT